MIIKKSAFSECVYRTLQKFYRLLPESSRKQGVIHNLGASVSNKFASREQDIYSESYYESDVEQAAQASGPVVAKYVIEKFAPKRVADVGCGTGGLLKAFIDKSIEAIGFEYSDAGRKMCAERGVRAEPFDVRYDQLPKDLTPFDVIICTEVAEHIPEKFADSLVNVLANSSDTVIFTAAPVGQGGTDHVNEQPPEYWIKKYAKHSFQYQEALTQQWREQWKADGAAWWYWKNLLIFQRAQSTQ